MSEENEAKQTESTSPAEDKARSGGWVPMDEWKGDEGDWVDYSEFNLRGELMGRINEQSSIINHLKNKVTDRDDALGDLKKLQKTLSDQAYKKALTELQAKKAQALEEDDYEGVVNLDEDIAELKDRKPKEEEQETVQEQNQVPAEITEWLSDPKNAWYHSDITLKAIADGIATGLQQQEPDISPSRLIKQVEEKLRKELPHRFNKDNVGAVDSGGEYTNSSSSRKTRTPSFSSLTDEQQEVCKRFEKIGLMTRTEYIKELQKAGKV